MSRDQILYFPGSPFARMARVLALEWSLPIEQVELGFPPDKDLFKKNPLGQVPVLVLADGKSYFPTLIVLEKLWEMNGSSSAAYRPETDRQTLLTVLQAGDALVAALYQSWAGLGPVDENQVGYDPGERHLERFGQSVDWAEEKVRTGDIPATIAPTSVALSCILLWSEARNGPQWRHRPILKNLVEGVEERPAFAATRPQPWRA